MRMPAVSRGRTLLYLAAILCLLVVGGRFLAERARPGSGGAPAESLSVLEIDAEPATSASAPELLVHVAGAVRRPGLYRLPAGSRIDDAVRAAGGAKRRAALDLVNLAAPLADGQQVVVPASGVPPAGSVAGSGGAPSGPVRLNTATLEQLDALPGVGPVTAQRILDYRAKHGSFSSVDELDAVPGIGPARLEQLRELVAP
jgi:competence protein ComEA